MTLEQWAALLSIVAALTITLASFREWVTIAVDGGTPLRRWARTMLGDIALMFVVACCSWWACWTIEPAIS